MKRLILYHNDADGQCAAAIAARWNTDLGKIIPQCEAVDYGEAPPWEILNALGEHDSLWIVDFSYDKGQMLKLIQKLGDRLHWFDHHKTAIKDLESLEGIEEVQGIRRVDTAACLLVWDFCHPGRKASLAVKYIADRDVWRFEHGDKTRFFYEKFLVEESTHPLAPVWDKYFEMTDWHYDAYLMVGEELWRGRRQMLKDIARRIGYECAFLPDRQRLEQKTDATPEMVQASEGAPPLSVLMINYPGSGDMGQVVKDIGYDLAWLYHMEYRHGQLVRVNSLYSDKVDVGEIAKGHGGGGHKGAAGFVEEM